MRRDPLVLRHGSGVLILFLFLLSPILRAEDAVAGRSPKTNAQNDPSKGDMPTAKASANVQEQAVSLIMTNEAIRLKLMLAKYDTNGDGQLDNREKNRMDADLEMWAKKHKQTLLKYDANKNGVLDQDEKEKMRQDKVLADRNERRFWSGELQKQQRMQQTLRRPPPSDLGITRHQRP